MKRMIKISKHDSFEIQWNKMIEGYKHISSSVISEIKEKILSCIVSTDMRYYLSKHFEELRSWDIIAIIVGSQKSLKYKYDTITELAQLFPHPFDEFDSCYDFEPYVELYKAAFADMGVDTNVFNAYLLNQHEYTESDSDTCRDTRPFPTFASAIKYIQEQSDEWTWGKNIDEALTWFTIEKWIGNGQTSIKATYTVSKYGEVWDYKQKQNNLHHEFGVSNALGLYLPIPFAVGDVIAIDCRPFVPLKHGVIVSIGDNHDCCCVQCLYAKNDGTLDVGALKHSHIFDDGVTPYISPLYGVRKVQRSLSANDEYFREIGDAIALWNAELREQEDFNEHSYALENMVWSLLDKGNTKDAFMDSVRIELQNAL